MQLLESTNAFHRFTAEEYMKLDLPERTELLGGMIYDVSPRNEPHILAVAKLTKYLVRGLGDEYLVRIQDAIAVSGWKGTNAPEIDIAVVGDRSYKITPTAADAFAFIEVSDTTYRADRECKIPLYVSAGVPAWIVNIPLRQVEFYGSAGDLEMKSGRVSTERDTLNILGVPISVADLFDRGST